MIKYKLKPEGMIVPTKYRVEEVLGVVYVYGENEWIKIDTENKTFFAAKYETEGGA